MKFCRQMRTLISRMATWGKIKIFKIENSRRTPS